MKERKERKKIGVPCTLQSAMLVTKYARTCNLLKIAGGKSSQRAGYRKETQKVRAEGERSNVLYCRYNTLQSGQVAKEKDAPCSKAKKSPSHVLYFALVRSLKKVHRLLAQNISAGNGPK